MTNYENLPILDRYADLIALDTGSAVLTSDSSDTVVLKSRLGHFTNEDGGEVDARILWDYGTHPFRLLYDPKNRS
jgi:hypothetical protein